METQVDIVCRTVAEGVLNCAFTDPDSPFWVYPVVIAVFFMAIAILALVARMTFKSGNNEDRRQVNKYVQQDRRKGFGT